MTKDEAMRMALDALITAELDGNCEYGATNALRTALAQPEPKPVAWLNKLRNGAWIADVLKFEGEEESIPLYFALPQRKSHCERCGKKLGTEVTDIHTCTPKEIVVWEALIESVRQMRDVQGMDGNWNYDPYMQGLFNGIEFSLSLIEVREPKFRDAPEKWLCDQPKARIFSGEKTHGSL